MFQSGAGMTTCFTLVAGSLLMFASLTFRNNLLRLKPALLETGGEGFQPSPMGTFNPVSPQEFVVLESDKILMQNRLQENGRKSQ